MVELISNGVFLYHGTDIVPADSSAALDQQEVFNKVFVFWQLDHNFW